VVSTSSEGSEAKPWNAMMPQRGVLGGEDILESPSIPPHPGEFLRHWPRGPCSDLVSLNACLLGCTGCSRVLEGRGQSQAT
jgi:hypothetical protein